MGMEFLNGTGLELDRRSQLEPNWTQSVKLLSHSFLLKKKRW